MRKLWLLLGIVLAAGGFFALAAGRAAEKGPAAAPAVPAATVDPSAGAPRIAVEPATFDFGNVLPQKTLQKDFTIRNHGGAELVIEKVSTTCGCTAALPGSKSIKPGASTSLRVTLETGAGSGRVSRSVLLRSNDPAQPNLELKLDATVAGTKP